MKTQPRRSSASQQIGVIAAIWAVQLVVSPLCLRRYRFGPLEWLWRLLTYWRLQGMKIRL